MIYLFLASFGLVLYGTLYPFTFMADAHTGGLATTFAQSMFVRPGRGDVVSNVVLFLPFGFFGMQALPERMPRLLRYLIVFGLGVGTSFAIECAQYYAPSRTTSLYDLGLNSISALVGAAGGRLNWQKMVSGGAVGVRPRSIYPLILIAAWLGYRLFPYVPTIDFQHIKDAIKPLREIASAPYADVIRHFAAILVVARLLQAVVAPRLAVVGLLLIAFGAIAAKPFIMTKIIAPGEVIGAVAAVVVWLAVLGRLQSRTAIVAVIFAISIAVQGLLPFELRPQASSFSLIPFSSFEGGSMSTNLQSFLEKVFLYGALVWLVVEVSRSIVVSVVLVAGLLTAIEIAQTFIVQRSAEITDPLLAVVMGLTLFALERHYRMSAKAGDESMLAADQASATAR